MTYNKTWWVLSYKFTANIGVACILFLCYYLIVQEVVEFILIAAVGKTNSIFLYAKTVENDTFIEKRIFKTGNSRFNWVLALN